MYPEDGIKRIIEIEEMYGAFTTKEEKEAREDELWVLWRRSQTRKEENSKK